jgi:hypothetical protein
MAVILLCDRAQNPSCVTTLLAKAIAQTSTEEGGAYTFVMRTRIGQAWPTRELSEIFELARAFEVRKRGLSPAELGRNRLVIAYR